MVFAAGRQKVGGLLSPGLLSRDIDPVELLTLLEEPIVHQI